MAFSALIRRSSKTYPFSVPYDLAGAEGLVVDAVEELDADVVILPTTLVHFARRLTALGVVVIGDSADVVSQLTRRVLKGVGSAAWRRPGLVVNHFAAVRQEQLFLGKCAEFWATTGAEAEILKDLAPHANVLVAGNAIDAGLIMKTKLPEEGPVGFIGNYSLAPNLDAACFLVEQVLPLLHQRRPGATLALAGAGMPAEFVSRLGKARGVELLGRVEESCEFIRTCRVMALTVHLRGGVPLKLVEALACGRPVVATREMVSGLSLQEGVEVLVGSEPGEIAAAISRVLGNSDLARSLAENGRIRFERDFSFATSLRQVKQSSVLAVR